MSNFVVGYIHCNAVDVVVGEVGLLATNGLRTAAC